MPSAEEALGSCQHTFIPAFYPASGSVPLCPFGDATGLLGKEVVQKKRTNPNSCFLN
jgi:hypothetical protein